LIHVDVDVDVDVDVQCRCSSQSWRSYVCAIIVCVDKNHWLSPVDSGQILWDTRRPKSPVILIDWLVTDDHFGSGQLIHGLKTFGLQSIRIMDFELSSDCSSDESSVVEVSKLLPGKNNKDNSSDEKKSIAQTERDGPIRLDNTTEEEPNNDRNFPFDFESSSDDSSVVELSRLLPSDGNDNNKCDKNQSRSMILESDAPCQLNTEAKTGNTRNGNDLETDNEKSKAIDSAIVSTTQLPKASSEKSKDKRETEINSRRRMVRVVMGESVKAWRRQRNVSQRNKMANVQNSNVSYSNVPDHGKHPKYAVVHKRDSSVAPKTEFQDSQLNVRRSTDDNNDKIDIVVKTTSGKHYAEDDTAVERPESMSYTAKKFKRQLSHHQSQTSLSSTPVSAPAFVDCIAIWDPARRLYVLEVPELIATDVSMFAKSDGNCGDGIHDNGNSERRRQDPLEQKRQAERKLQSHRKRRRL